MEKQLIEKVYSSPYDVARKYFSVVFVVNDINVTSREMDMLVFSALHGTISTPPVRDLFMEKYGVSKNTVWNLSSSLQEKGVLIKVKNKVRLHPLLIHNFKEGMALGIKLEYNEDRPVENTDSPTVK